MAVPRILKIVEDEEVISITGKKLPMKFDTICVHGDNPAAVAMAQEIRDGLIKAGVTITGLREIVK